MLLHCKIQPWCPRYPICLHDERKLMFTEYPEQIKQLRARDKRFDYLCDKHSTLDAEIQALLDRKSPSLQLEIEQLKKQKLRVKEELYAMLQQALPELELKQQKNYMSLQTLAQSAGIRLRA
ncbi:MAG TPA: hypothetical protein DEF75_06315 [Comamonas kerstersii]|nr:hypothetical protein [Comamonas kerstersii]